MVDVNFVFTCVNISVGNWFDFASSRTNQLVIGNQFVDHRQRPQIRFRCQSLSKNSADYMLLPVADFKMITRPDTIITVKSVSKHPCIDQDNRF